MSKKSISLVLASALLVAYKVKPTKELKKLREEAKTAIDEIQCLEGPGAMQAVIDKANKLGLNDAQLLFVMLGAEESIGEELGKAEAEEAAADEGAEPEEEKEEEAAEEEQTELKEEELEPATVEQE